MKRLILPVALLSLGGACLAQTPQNFSTAPYWCKQFEGRSVHFKPYNDSNMLFQEIIETTDLQLKSPTMIIGLSFRHEGSLSYTYTGKTLTTAVALSTSPTITASTYSTNPKNNRGPNYSVCFPKTSINLPTINAPQYPWKPIFVHMFNKAFLYSGGHLMVEVKNYDTAGNTATTYNADRNYPGYVDTLAMATMGPYGWFGTECPTGTNTITVNTSNLKVGGAWYSILATPSAQNSTAISFLGFNCNQWLMLPLPFQLDFLGMTGCTLYTGIQMQQNGVWDATNTQYRANWTFPNDNSLAGLILYNQWMILDMAAPGGAGFSHCLNCMIAPATSPGMPLRAKYGYWTGTGSPDLDPTLIGSWNGYDTVILYHP